MAEHWTSHRFSLGNPRYDGAGDLPLLLRRLAQEIEDRGIKGMDIDDLTLSQEITEDGPWFSATVYWTPDEPSAAADEHHPAPAEDDDLTPAAATETTRVPVAEALPGVSLHPLPEDESVVAALAMIKTRDADGLTGWYTRATHDYNRVEFLGALTAYVDHLRVEEASGWSDDEEAPHTHGDIDA